MKTGLKPCPSCGKEAETVSTAFFERLVYRTRCKDCSFSTGFSDTKEEAERAWNRRYEPPNEPLTLEELRQMDGKTVWVECERSYGRVISDGIKASVSTHDALYTRPENYTMYRRRPEEVLTGEELAEIACAINLLKEYQSLGLIDYLRELAQAEKDGRLIVLPKEKP